jgi:hypothetical protein
MRTRAKNRRHRACKNARGRIEWMSVTIRIVKEKDDMVFFTTIIHCNRSHIITVNIYASSVSRTKSLISVSYCLKYSMSQVPIKQNCLWINRKMSISIALFNLSIKNKSSSSVTNVYFSNNHLFENRYVNRNTKNQMIHYVWTTLRECHCYNCSPG